MSGEDRLVMGLNGVVTMSCDHSTLLTGIKKLSSRELKGGYVVPSISIDKTPLWATAAPTKRRPARIAILNMFKERREVEVGRSAIKNFP